MISLVIFSKSEFGRQCAVEVMLEEMKYQHVKPCCYWFHLEYALDSLSDQQFKMYDS
jgi:hypothetical protein